MPRCRSAVVVELNMTAGRLPYLSPITSDNYIGSGVSVREGRRVAVPLYPLVPSCRYIGGEPLLLTDER